MSQSEARDNETSDASDGGDATCRNLSAAAKRALAEAEARRTEREADAEAAVKELGGQSGPDPARYGDWEKDGIISDF